MGRENGTPRNTGKGNDGIGERYHLGAVAHGLIYASVVTEDHEQDPSQVPDLLGQVKPEIQLFVGDGIYDQDPVYETVKKHSPGAIIIVPPRKDAAVSSSENSNPSQRDNHILRIQQIGRSQ